MNYKSILTTITALLFLILENGCEKETIIEYVSEDSTKVEIPQYIITNFGAIGDGQTDCSGIINQLIRNLPPSGGTIIIPEGDFLIDNPIVIDRNFVTLKGINQGLRSNVDVPLSGLKNPGGGSKLLLGKANSAIEIPVLPDVNGRKNRVSGVNIENLLISGGESSDKGIGINILQDNDGFRIKNVVAINLHTGIVANASDAIIISSCWISEVKNSVVMNHGIQNMISNCQLGAQPGGITVNLTNQENLLMSGNHIYPDGDINLQMTDCNYNNISSNNFQSYYIGIIEVNDGSYNLLSDNMIWMRRPDEANRQMRGKDKDYGVVRISGNQNMFSNSSVNCDWADATGDPVSIRSVSGTKNSFYNLKFSSFDSSDRLFYVNETTEIFNSAPLSKIAVEGSVENIYVRY